MKIKLNGNQWRLSVRQQRDGDGRDVERGREYVEVPATVPGEVHQDLYQSQLIPDLYKGEKELAYRWIAQSDWSYTSEFKVTDDELKAYDEVQLVCDGIDTIADIFINGTKVNIGAIDNMFRVFRFDIKSLVKANASNVIEVVIYSPVKYCKEQASKSPYEIPLWEYPNGAHHRNYIRKCACHFGWDWGPCFCPLGIYKDIYLEFRSVPSIVSIQVQPKGVDGSQLREGHMALVHIQGTVSDYRSDNVVLDVNIFEKGDENTPVSSARVLIDDRYAFKTAMEIPHAKIWWPSGYGKQPLYILEIKIDSVLQYKTQIGLRGVAVDTSKDEHGNKFQIVVNGVPVFAKGADWIPADHFLTRISRDTYEHLLTSAKEANMNCLRVWGGGIYEDDYFYDLCDELGILLWQDFMFGCALYPTTHEFLENVRLEVIDQVRRIGNHPSIALWCGSNESEQAIIEKLWDPIKQNPQRYTIDYNKLYIETILPALGSEAPEAFYWPSSPSNGVGEWGDCNDQTRGDTHYWAVWHSDMPFTQYLKAKSRFLSEFGFQSLPSYLELKKVLSSEDQLNITSPEMEGRQRSPKPGNLGILRHIGLHFRVPGSFEDMCYISQILQAVSIKAGCEHWRRMRPYCMGTLYWQLNDIWVGPSWSSIEYNGQWKALQYFAKRFYKQLLVSFHEPQDDMLELWVTNDNITGSISVDLELQLVHLAESTTTTITRSKVVVPSESSTSYFTISKSDLFKDKNPREYIVTAQLLGNGHPIVDNVFYPCAFKQLNLQPTKISIEDIIVDKHASTFDITLVSKDSTALFVWIEPNHLNNYNGTFSDNGFHLLKASPKTIQFKIPPLNMIEFSKDQSKLFKVKSLRDTY